jgi:hypothetical protein
MKRTIRLAAMTAFAVMVGIFVPAVAANATGSPGNSGAAHACQQGGYLSLVGADGTTFSNVGACVSFAAHGGQFATGLVIPAGETATLSGASFNACDPLEYGYQLNLGANVIVDTTPAICENNAAAGAVVGPFSTATLLRIVLIDDQCGGGPTWTYYSDGNHASVTGSNPATVDIMDSGICAFDSNTPRPPSGPGTGNLTVTVTIA